MVYVTGVLVLVLVLPLPCVHAAAQQTESDVPPSGRLTFQAVEAQLGIVQASTAFDEATRTRLAGLYTAALEQLRLQQEWEQKAAEFEDLRVRAPQLLTDIEGERGRPSVQPEIPEGISLAEASQRLATAEAELAASVAAREQLDNEPSRRAERRKRIPESLADANRRLEEARAQLTLPAEDTQPPEMAQARRMLAQARVQAIEAEKDAYEKELHSYEARGRLLTLRQDLAVRRVSENEKLVNAWASAVSALREEEARQAAAQASQALLLAAEQADPLIGRLAKELAEQNAALVERRISREGLLKKIDAASRVERELDAKLAKVVADYSDVRAKAKTTTLTNAIGLLLRKHRRELPKTRLNRSNVAERNTVIAQAQFEQMELQEQRRELADIEGLVNEALAPLAPPVGEPQEETIADILQKLYTTKRDSLDALLADYDTYIDVLLKVQLKEQELIDRADEFAGFIDERVLWIRSGSPVHLSDIGDSLSAAAWLLAWRKWREICQALGSDLLSNPIKYIFALFVLALILLGHRRSTARIRYDGEMARKPTCVSFGFTIESFMATLFISAVGPAVLWFIGWRLGTATFMSEFGRGLGSGLNRMAVILFTFEFPRQIMRRDGLAEAQYDWPVPSLRVARRHLLWLMTVGSACALLIAVLEGVGDERKAESLGRLTFVIAMGAYAAFGHTLMRPGKGPIPAGISFVRGQRSQRLDTLWYLAAVGTPIILGALACAGYFYTALRLSCRAHGTVFFVLSLFVFRGLVLRWLVVTRRRLAREQARKRREALKTHTEEGGTQEEQAGESELDLAEVNARTQRLVRSFLVFSLIAGIWIIWADVLPALGILNHVELWQTTAEVSETVQDAEGRPFITTREEVTPVTLAHLCLAILVALMTLMVVRNLPGVLEVAILQRLPLASGERYAITTILGYTILFTGVVIAFHVIGIGWGKVQWLVAAMGVGLGFGLQEIFANFVSGLIILFERPIRVGDTVTIGGISGTVSKIRIRATRILDWDRKELIVPNKEFVTGQLINWTLSDSILRVIVPVGIAYGSDTELAVKLLYQVANDHPLVLVDPGPKVLFLEFGDSSLNFELRVFCPDIDSFLQLKHELHMAIDKAFREAGVEIAFPQRDIHVRSFSEPVPFLEKGRRATDECL